MLKRTLIAAAMGMSLHTIPANVNAGATQPVEIVFHTIKWTYESDSSTNREAVLRRAETCTKMTSRKAAEDCLRQNRWKQK